MKLSVCILVAIFLLLLCACSTTPVPPHTVVKTEYIKERPSEQLLKVCVPHVDKELLVTRDIVTSRYAWIKAYCECSSKNNRLLDWHNGTTTPLNKICNTL